MSRRKQSNPKPIKFDEEEEDDEELEEEVEHNHSSLEGGESGDVVDDEEVENSNVKASSPKIKSCTQGNSLLTSFECPVCMKELETQHDFTVHIRMHNSEEHTTTHTCSLCAKTLSSASSLDRHMLVHSGERPFKCSRCNMAFTTNGNMHRHMRTHHGESSSSANNRNVEDEPRIRTPTKRLAASPRPDDESAVPAKKSSGVEVEVEEDEMTTNEEGGSGQMENTGEEVEEQLHCPVCSKGFLCKYGLQTHLETHPDYVFKCHECNLTFRNYRGLNRHQYVAHVKRNGVKKDAAVKQTQNATLVGFQDLTFLDFSSAKFAVVAKAFCEKNARRPSSAFHIFECPQCKKAFPCGSALKMHLKSHTNHLVNHHQCEGVECLQVPFADKENFLAVLGLQANTTPTKEERRAEEPYENPAYFTHGMPCNKSSRSWGSCSNLTSDGEDFADIQSILSLTTCPALLSNMNGSANSVSASSSSPRRGLAVNPESPATADSATASPKMPSDVSEQAATSTSHSMNSIHPGRFPCKLCPLVFPNLRALKGHNRSHLGMSPYRCNMCSYTSIDKSTLLRHLRTHNGERPFLCRLCQYAFTTKANCERHMRKRHGKHNKQEICSAMEQKPQLHDPENTLNSFHCPDTVCKYCNVDFKFYRILRHHLRSLHSSCARKPFQCRQCHMGFSTKNNCYRHVQKQHTELKDNVEESIWCCYSDTLMAPGKEGRDDDDGDAEDERSGNENDGMHSPALSVSPGPPLLDPIVPIPDTSLSDMEMSSVEALVSWSTRSLAEVPLQEEPLDLAVHPVDLTLKKSAGMNKDNSPPRLPKINQPTIHIPTPSASSSSSYSHLPPPPGIRVQTSPFVCRSLCNSFSYQNPLSAPELSPGSTISSSPSPSSLCSIDVTRASKSTCPSPVAANLTKQGSLSAGALVKKQKQKQKRYRTERPFKCDHCDAGFTLRSNMERHIKQQHPDQWMMRSRGRKPSLSSSSNSRPLLPRANQESSLLKPISNQVKEAISQQIRQRLAITAASSGDEKGQAGGVQLKKEASSEVQEHAQDLVSVSRLLDTATAQNIQEIFRQAETNKETNQRRNEEGKGEVKRSAYTNAPHRVSCPFCARRFPWTSSLRRHILTHTGQKPFKCQYCPLLFTTKSNCDRHLVRKHGGVAGDPDNRTAPERPYRCVMCPNSAFSTPSNLRKHMQQKHEQEDEKMWEDMMENEDGDGNQADEYDEDGDGDGDGNGNQADDFEENENELGDDDVDDEEDDYGDNDDDDDDGDEEIGEEDEERCKSKAESLDGKANDEENVPSVNQDEEVSENEEENK